MKITLGINRRCFLAGSAATLAAVGTPAWAAPSEKKHPYKKSLKIGMVKTGGSLSDKFKLLKRLDYDGVELNSPNDLKLDDVKRAKDESGLLVPGVVDSAHWRQRLSDPDPAVRAAGVEALKTAIRDAKTYGGTSVLLVPGKVDDAATYAQCWERSQQEIKKVLPLAEDEGIHILIENVWNDFLTDPAETAKYVDALDSKMAGAYFDVGNAVYFAPPAKWIRTLSKRVVKLDIKDYSLELAKENPRQGFGVKLTEGDANWPELIKALREIGYTSGWGSAEVPGGDEERLREISERMDRCFTS